MLFLKSPRHHKDSIASSRSCCTPKHLQEPVARRWTHCGSNNPFLCRLLPDLRVSESVLVGDERPTLAACPFYSKLSWRIGFLRSPDARRSRQITHPSQLERSQGFFHCFHASAIPATSGSRLFDARWPESPFHGYPVPYLRAPESTQCAVMGSWSDCRVVRCPRHDADRCLENQDHGPVK
jgi:hypothetical protein